MLELLTFLLVEANPAFREESMRIWEDLRVDVLEDGCHADDRLQSIRLGQA